MPGTSEPLLNISPATNPLSAEEQLQESAIKKLGKTVMFAGLFSFIGLLSIGSELMVDPKSEKGETAMVVVNSIAFIPAIIQALNLGRLTDERAPYLWFATMLVQVVQGPVELLGDIYDIKDLSNTADILFILGVALELAATVAMVKDFNNRKNDFNAAVCFAISITLALSAMKVSGNLDILLKAFSCLYVAAAGYCVGKTADDFIDEIQAKHITDIQSANDPEEQNLNSRQQRLGSASVFNPADADAANRLLAFNDALTANEAGGPRDPAARH